MSSLDWKFVPLSAPADMQAKVSLEKQREKERSIALLKKKEQEALHGVLFCRDPVEFMCNCVLLSVGRRRKVHIKDQDRKSVV